jgi:ribulose-phosphate 3-epimerase
MHNVIPGILEKDWIEIERKLAVVRRFSKTVHIDFLDGKFSPESSFMDFNYFIKYKDDFFLEAHLMTENPTQYIRQLAAVGFKRFLGHVEKMKDIDEFIAEGQIFGEVGLALDLDTPTSLISISFDDLDVILLMAVKAGKSGQSFSQSALLKIQELRKRTIVPIEVDGGITDESITAARVSGANKFVTTNFLFNSEDPLNSFEKLESLISS